MPRTFEPITKGDRRLVRGSQRLKASRELVLMRDMVKHYEQQGKDLAAAYREAGEAGIDQVFAQASPGLEETLLENNTETAGILGDWQMRQLTPKSSRPDHRTKIFEAEIIGSLEGFLLAEATRSVFLVTSTDRAISARIIARGIAEGLGTEPIARSLQAQFGGVLGQVRSAAISRTEVGIVGSKAQNQGAINLDAQTKQWIQVADARARDIHTDVDGLAIGMNEMFFPGGESMAHPHDTRASAMNLVNCRCDILYSR